MPDNKPPFAKILVAITEDWFLLSHFRPLIIELRLLAREVVVVTRDSGRLAEVRSLGVRTIDLDYNRSSLNPVREAATIKHFLRILHAEKPDVLHLIAMKPIVLGGVAGGLARVPHTIVHMTGLGFLAISPTVKARAARLVALAILRRVIARGSSWLVVENPEDLAFLKDGGVKPEDRVTILGGAGIDPEAFPELPEPRVEMPIAAFVGRMIHPKGVDVLMEAAALLKQRGVPLAVELYGRSDDGNLEAIPSSVLTAWSDGDRTKWLGFTSDVAAIWRRAATFRIAGPQPRRHAARAAGGRSLRPPTDRHGRARMPPLR
ncbi:MAG: glycosyltransferase family 4 protein, partial [Sphingomonadales bacterium]|nr:glycosyltransferase family 4 protein [Sphingomonadales bacterium]